MRRFLRIASIIAATAFTSAGIIEADAQNDYWRQRVSLFEKLPVQPGDIVFLGNSITDGGEFQELLDREDVKNRGIVGDVISGVRKRLGQVTSGHPSRIFLLIGINDVSHGLSARQIADRYAELVSEIREATPNTILYVQSVLPINNDFRRYKNLFGREGVIPELNEMLREISSEQGAVYVDLWPLFADPQTGKMKRELTSDGLHLSGEGYKTWAKAIRPLIGSAPENREVTIDEEERDAIEVTPEEEPTSPLPKVSKIER